MIPQFCFPDIDRLKPTTKFKRFAGKKSTCKLTLLTVILPSLHFTNSETFSFVLTNMEGNRRFGYCRRLLVSYNRLSFFMPPVFLFLLFFVSSLFFSLFFYVPLPFFFRFFCSFTLNLISFFSPPLYFPGLSSRLVKDRGYLKSRVLSALSDASLCMKR